MKTRLAKTQKALLFVAGALLILVSSFILASPADFYASNNIELGANVNLLNELKAPAGLLLVAGLFMIGAVFVRSQADTALWLAALIYLSYAGSRLVSMALDGLPATGLVQAAALEGIVGMACLVVLAIRRIPARRAGNSGNRIPITRPASDGPG
jgi:low temperature requirement protein LtrA